MATVVEAGAPSGGARSSPLAFLNTRSGRLGLYVVKRILWMVPVVFFVILVTFVLMHGAPGSPWDRGGGRQLSAAVMHNLDVKYGLDKSLPEQFMLYLNNVVHLDFGDSYQSAGVKVSTLILQGWRYTATIGVLAFLLIVPVGIGTGVLAALRHNTRTDAILLGMSTIGASVPNFVVGVLLVLAFAVFPYGLSGGNFSLPSSGPPDPAAPLGIDFHLIMPVLTLSFLPIAYIARLTRSSTLDILQQDYVRTAWSKGLAERGVVTRHVLKNSLIPVVTALGPTFALLVTGSIVVETVFQIPGVGREFINAISSHDYPMILALVIQFAIVIAVANLVVDLLYVVIDPRIRLE